MALAVKQRLDQAASQRLARGLDQPDQPLVERRGLEQRLEDCGQIADRDPLAEQLFEDPAHLAQGEQLGHQFLEKLWLALVERVHQPLGLGPAQQLEGVPADEFSQMRGDHRDRVHHRVAGGDGLVLQSRRDPDRGHSEGRLARLPAGQRPAPRVAGDGQQLRPFGLPAADLHPAQAEEVLARLEAQVVGDVHRGHQKSHLRREMAAQRAHPAEQLPALLLVHQRNQLKPDLQGQLLQAQQVGQVRALSLAGLLLLAHRLSHWGRHGTGRHAPPGNE